MSILAYNEFDKKCRVVNEQAARIADLEAKLARVVEVLEPFAKAAGRFTSNVHNGGLDQVKSSVNGEDFRRARSLHTELTKGD